MYQMIGNIQLYFVLFFYVQFVDAIHLFILLCMPHSYYALKSSETSMRLKPVGKIIQHSIPVLELRTPFIPSNLGTLRLQNFHRPALKKYSHGLLAQNVYHPVFSLSREISVKAKVYIQQLLFGF